MISTDWGPQPGRKDKPDPLDPASRVYPPKPWETSADVSPSAPAQPQRRRGGIFSGTGLTLPPPPPAPVEPPPRPETKRTTGGVDFMDRDFMLGAPPEARSLMRKDLLQAENPNMSRGQAIRETPIERPWDQPGAKPRTPGAVETFAGEFGRQVVPSTVGAIGQVKGAAVGALGGVPGAIAGHTAGGMVGHGGTVLIQRELTKALYGQEGLDWFDAEEAAGREAHPFAARAGALLGSVPMLLTGKGVREAISKTGAMKGVQSAVDAGSKLTRGQRAVQVGAGALQGGTTFSARSGAAVLTEKYVKKTPGYEDVSVIDEMAKSFVGGASLSPAKMGFKALAQFNPTVAAALRPFEQAAKSYLGSIFIEAPSSAAILSTAEAMYDTVVHQKPFAPHEILKDTVVAMPSLMAMNAILGAPGAYTKWTGSKGPAGGPRDGRTRDQRLRDERLSNSANIRRFMDAMKKEAKAKGGFSPEARVLMGGARPEDVGTTVQRVASLAKKWGVNYSPSESSGASPQQQSPRSPVPGPQTAPGAPAASGRPEARPAAQTPGAPQAVPGAPPQAAPAPIRMPQQAGDAADLANQQALEEIAAALETDIAAPEAASSPEIPDTLFQPTTTFPAGPAPAPADASAPVVATEPPSGETQAGLSPTGDTQPLSASGTIPTETTQGQAPIAPPDTDRRTVLQETGDRGQETGDGIQGTADSGPAAEPSAIEAELSALPDEAGIRAMNRAQARAQAAAEGVRGPNRGATKGDEWAGFTAKDIQDRILKMRTASRKPLRNAVPVPPISAPRAGQPAVETPKPPPPAQAVRGDESGSRRTAASPPIEKEGASSLQGTGDREQETAIPVSWEDSSAEDQRNARKYASERIAEKKPIFPNRSLGFEYAVDNSGTPQGMPIASIAIANLKEGEQIPWGGRTWTVIKTTKARITLESNGERRNISPNSKKWAQFERDMDGLLMAANHGVDPGDLLNAWNRDPVSRIGEQPASRKGAERQRESGLRVAPVVSKQTGKRFGVTVEKVANPSRDAERAEVEAKIARGEKVPMEVMERFPWLAADEVIKLNRWANNTPSIMPDGTMNPALGNRAYFEISNKFKAINREIDRRNGVVKITKQQVDADAPTVKESLEVAKTAKPAGMTRSELLAEFAEHDTAFRKGGLSSEEYMRRSDRESRLRKEGYRRFGIENMDDAAQSHKPTRNPDLIRKEITALQKRLDAINAHRPRAFEGGTRATATTHAARAGALSESIGALKEELAIAIGVSHEGMVAARVDEAPAEVARGDNAREKVLERERDAGPRSVNDGTASDERRIADPPELKPAPLRKGQPVRYKGQEYFVSGFPRLLKKQGIVEITRKGGSQPKAVRADVLERIPDTGDGGQGRPEIRGQRPKVTGAGQVEQPVVTDTPDGVKVEVHMSAKAEAKVTPKEQKKYFIDQIDAAIDAATEISPARKDRKDATPTALGSAAEDFRANAEEIGTVEIEVPGDGTFTLLNTKDALRKLKARAAAMFPATPPTASAPSKPSGKPSAIAKVGPRPGAAVKPAWVKLLDPFTVKDKNPTPKRAEIVTPLFSPAKNETVATDSRRLVVALGVKIGTPIQEGGPQYSYVVPGYRQNQLPQKQNDQQAVRVADTEQFIRQLRQAKMATEKRKDGPDTIGLYAMPDGSVAVAAMYAGDGYVSQDVSKGTMIGAYTADFVDEIVTFLRKTGNQSIEIRHRDEDSPMVLLGAKEYAVLMPVRGTAMNAPDAMDGMVPKTEPARFAARQPAAAETDRNYLAAVERGDTETAQRIVDEAAKRAGYILDVDHQTNEKFTAFEAGELGFHLGKNIPDGMLGAETMRLKAAIKNPLRLDDAGAWNLNADSRKNVITQLWQQDIITDEEMSDLRSQAEFANEELQRRWGERQYDDFGYKKDLYKMTGFIRDVIKEKGYDGIVYRNEAEGYEDSYIAFDSSQLKSADAITRDDTGRIIPPSERFNPQRDDIRFAAAGVNAQTADKGRYQEAERMEAAGKSRESIWRKTGWWKGPDGKWRFEIDDSKMKVLPELKNTYKNRKHVGKATVDSVSYRKNENGTYDVSFRKKDAKTTADFIAYTGLSGKELTEMLGQDAQRVISGKGKPTPWEWTDAEFDFPSGKMIDLPGIEIHVDDGIRLSAAVDHPELFRAYPQLQNVIVGFIGKSTWNGPQGMLAKTDDGTPVILLNNNDARWGKTLLHEIQHAIQAQEDFAMGGSIEGVQSMRGDPSQTLANLRQSDPVSDAWLKEQDRIIDETDASQLDAVLKAHRKTAPKSLLRFWDESSRLSGTDENVYRLLAGEVEARFVQRRLDLPPAQRKAVPPWQTMETMLREEGLLQPGQKPEDALIFRKALATEAQQSMEDSYGSDAESGMAPGAGGGGTAGLGLGNAGRDAVRVSGGNQREGLSGLERSGDARSDEDGREATWILEEAKRNEHNEPIARAEYDAAYAETPGFTAVRDELKAKTGTALVAIKGSTAPTIAGVHMGQKRIGVSSFVPQPFLAGVVNHEIGHEEHTRRNADMSLLENLLVEESPEAQRFIAKLVQLWSKTHGEPEARAIVAGIWREEMAAAMLDQATEGGGLTAYKMNLFNAAGGRSTIAKNTARRIIETSGVGRAKDENRFALQPAESRMEDSYGNEREAFGVGRVEAGESGRVGGGSQLPYEAGRDSAAGSSESLWGAGAGRVDAERIAAKARRRAWGRQVAIDDSPEIRETMSDIRARAEALGAHIVKARHDSMQTDGVALGGGDILIATRNTPTAMNEGADHELIHVLDDRGDKDIRGLRKKINRGSRAWKTLKNWLWTNYERGLRASGMPEQEVQAWLENHVTPEDVDKELVAELARPTTGPQGINLWEAFGALRKPAEQSYAKVKGKLYAGQPAALDADANAGQDGRVKGRRITAIEHFHEVFSRPTGRPSISSVGGFFGGNVQKSNRAMEAEDHGLVDGKELVRLTGIPWDTLSRVVPSQEWHHVGYGTADYYSFPLTTIEKYILDSFPNGIPGSKDFGGLVASISVPKLLERKTTEYRKEYDQSFDPIQNAEYRDLTEKIQKMDGQFFAELKEIHPKPSDYMWVKDKTQNDHYMKPERQAIKKRLAEIRKVERRRHEEKGESIVSQKMTEYIERQLGKIYDEVEQLKQTRAEDQSERFAARPDAPGTDYDGARVESYKQKDGGRGWKIVYQDGGTIMSGITSKESAEYLLAERATQAGRAMAAIISSDAIDADRVLDTRDAMIKALSAKRIDVNKGIDAVRDHLRELGLPKAEFYKVQGKMKDIFLGMKREGDDSRMESRAVRFADDVMIHAVKAKSEHDRAVNELKGVVRKINRYGAASFGEPRRAFLEETLGSFTFKKMRDSEAIMDALASLRADERAEITEQEMREIERLVSSDVDSMDTDELDYMSWVLSRTLDEQRAAREARHGERSARAKAEARQIVNGIVHRKDVDFDSLDKEMTGGLVGWYKGELLPTRSVAYVLDGGEERGPVASRFFWSFWEGRKRAYRVAREVAEAKQAALGDEFNEQAFKRPTDTRKIAKSQMGKTTRYQLAAGKTVDLYDGERITIYLSSLNERNMRHLTHKKGGFILEDSPSSRPIRFTEDDVAAIAADVATNPDLMRVVDAVRPIFNGMLKQHLNETSEAMHAETIADEDNYLPMVSAQMHRQMQSLDASTSGPGDIQNAARFTIESMGSLKRRIPSARNPLMLYDVFTLLDRSTRVAGMYSGFAEPLDMAKRVRSPILDEDGMEVGTVEGAVRRGFGSRYWDSIMDLARTYEEPRKPSDSESMGLRGLNLMTRGALAWNIPVKLAQAVSYAQAFPYMPAKYWWAGLRSKPATWEEMGRTNDVLWWRGRGMASIAIGEAYENESDRFGQRGMRGILEFDRKAIGRIWNAAKMYERDLDPSASNDEIETRAGNRVADEIIMLSQPSFEPETRSKAQRETNLAVRSIMRFSSQRTKNFDMLFRALYDYKNKKIDPSEFAKKIGVLLAAQLAYSALKTAVEVALKRREPDEAGDQFMKTLVSALASLGGRGVEMLVDIVNAARSGGRYRMQDPIFQVLQDTGQVAWDAGSSAFYATSGEPDRAGRKVARAADRGLRLAGTVSGTGIHNFAEPGIALFQYAFGTDDDSAAPAAYPQPGRPGPYRDPWKR